MTPTSTDEERIERVRVRFDAMVRVAVAITTDEVRRGADAEDGLNATICAALDVAASVVLAQVGIPDDDRPDAIGSAVVRLRMAAARAMCDAARDVLAERN